MQQQSKKYQDKFILPGLSTFNIPSISQFHFDDSLKFITTQKNIHIDSNHFLYHHNDQNHQSQEEDSLAVRLEKQQPATSSGKKKRIGCTCKKTFCLKMYCECFANSKTCNDDCICCQCKNIDQNQQVIKQAKQNVKEKSIHSCSLTQKRCNCKKSFCQKKYCECFNAGVSCSQSCKCIECYNRQFVSQRKRPQPGMESNLQLQHSDGFLQKSVENIQNV